MAVYVDDANIPATVPNGRRSHTSTWCHLTADSQEELHEFAARLGLKRSWFQPGRPVGGNPGPFWHYDVTAGKRAQAVRLGALEVSARDMPVLMRSREPGRRAADGHHAPARARLLFTSSRDGVTEADVEPALRGLFSPDKILVTGGARGGDQIAERLWSQWGGQVDSHPVSPEAWQRSRGAGYARNAEMVADVKASGGECLAVIARCVNPQCTRTEPHGTHGAVHCAGLAQAAGLPVTRVKAGAGPAGDTGGVEPGARPAGLRRLPLAGQTTTRVAGAKITSGDPAPAALTERNPAAGTGRREREAEAGS